jgi:hypothetical protein
MTKERPYAVKAKAVAVESKEWSCPYDAARKAETIAALDAYGVIRDIGNICAEYASDCPGPRYFTWRSMLHLDLPYLLASKCDCTATERGRMFAIEQLTDEGQFERRATLHTRNPAHRLYLRGDPGLPAELRRGGFWLGVIHCDPLKYYFHGNSRVAREIRKVMEEDSPPKAE